MGMERDGNLAHGTHRATYNIGQAACKYKQLIIEPGLHRSPNLKSWRDIGACAASAWRPVVDAVNDKELTFGDGSAKNEDEWNL